MSKSVKVCCSIDLNEILSFECSLKEINKLKNENSEIRISYKEWYILLHRLPYLQETAPKESAKISYLIPNMDESSQDNLENNDFSLKDSFQKLESLNQKYKIYTKFVPAVFCVNASICDVSMCHPTRMSTVS